MPTAIVNLSWATGAGGGAYQSFEYDRGESVVLRFAPGTATDITGWTLRFLMCPCISGATATFDRNTPTEADGIVITDAVNGEFEVHLPETITASSSVPDGPYAWEMWRIDGGEEDLIARGGATAVATTEALTALPPLPPIVPPPLSVALGGTGATSLGAGISNAGGVLTAPAALTGNTLWFDAVNGVADPLPGRADKPYLTLAAPLAASASGDVGKVRPGAYTVTSSIAANLVHWDFDAGTTVTRTGDDGNGLIDDELATAMAFTVAGAADLVLVAGTGGGETSTIRVGHADSDVSVWCRSVRCQAAGLDVFGTAVYGVAGRLFVDADFIGWEIEDDSVTTAVWWANGDMHVEAGRIFVAGGNGTGVLSNCDATPTGEGFVRANEIAARTVILQNGADATAGMWVDAPIIRAIDGGTAVLALGSNRLYVDALKVFGRVGVTGGAGLTYVRTQKWVPITDGTSGEPGLALVSGGSGQTIIEVPHASPEAFTGDMFRFTGGTGVTEIRGMRYVANSGSNGISVTGGTLRLVNCHIDTSANSGTNPIVKSGGTLELVNCTLIAEGTRNAIEASTAQTVSVTGGRMNRPCHANVSLVGLPNLDDLGSELAVTGAGTAKIGRMHVCSGTIADYTQTLPTAVGNEGARIGFRMSDALTRFVTLDGDGSETINGQTTLVMWAGETAVLRSDGTSWYKIAGKSIPMLCSMRKSSDQAVNGSLGGAVEVDINTTDVDNTGRMADAANNRITCRRAGSYLVIGSVKWTNLPGNTSRLQTVVQKNGAYLADGESSGLAGSYLTTMANETAVALAAGDNITLNVFHNSASAQTLFASDRGLRLSVQELPTW